MSRLEACFAALRDGQRKALVPFIIAGDPSAEVTLETMHVMVQVGANIIELGVPFSDPMADGPVIQLASERALKSGMSVSGVFEIVRRFRERNQRTPVVLMGYLNPVEAKGHEAFATAAAQAGVDGVLIVDLPPEEAEGLHGALAGRGLDMIFLLAPNSGAERVRRVAERASGYLYYVSLKGVTGSAALDVEAVARRVSEIKTMTDLPIAVGFGIRDADAAAKVSTVSDAVVVGSVLVQEMQRLGAEPDQVPAAVGGILAGMREAMDAVGRTR